MRTLEEMFQLEKWGEVDCLESFIFILKNGAVLSKEQRDYLERAYAYFGHTHLLEVLTTNKEKAEKELPSVIVTYLKCIKQEIEELELLKKYFQTDCPIRIFCEGTKIKNVANIYSISEYHLGTREPCSLRGTISSFVNSSSVRTNKIIPENNPSYLKNKKELERWIEKIDLRIDLLNTYVTETATEFTEFNEIETAKEPDFVSEVETVKDPDLFPEVEELVNTVKEDASSYYRIYRKLREIISDKEGANYYLQRAGLAAITLINFPPDSLKELRSSKFFKSSLVEESLFLVRLLGLETYLDLENLYPILLDYLTDRGHMAEVVKILKLEEEELEIPEETVAVIPEEQISEVSVGTPPEIVETLEFEEVPVCEEVATLKENPITYATTFAKCDKFYLKDLNSFVLEDCADFVLEDCTNFKIKGSCSNFKLMNCEVYALGEK